MTQSQALAILKTGVNAFLTGEPGSGKTHTVNEYAQYLRARGIEPAITASTGIAAAHLGGLTIHSWSGIGIKDKLSKSELAAIADNNYIIRRVGTARVLIIDEISMLRPETLNLVEAVCRAVKKDSRPFGGLQVVFTGDFFQLPPVVKSDSGVQTALLDGSGGVFAYQSAAWRSAQPAVCYLSEQYRQDDKDFLDVLSAIRRNAFNTEHGRRLASRKIHISAAPAHAPKLYSHNVDVDRVNKATLSKLPGELREFEMQSQGKRALVEALKKGCLSPEILQLKAGASVMFTKNNPKEGFVNGTLGVVQSFDKDGGCPLVKTSSGKRIAVLPMDWTVEENGRVRARLTQLPLRLAWAITVHKSQGMGLDAAVMDLSGVFEFGQGYVALSRVRRLSGLHLLGWNDRAFVVHPEALAQDELFRAAARAAAAELAQLSSVELAAKQNDFIMRTGGMFAPEMAARGRPASGRKIDTRAATLSLWKQGKTLSQIAAARGLKESTVFGHIELLALRGRIKRGELSRLLTPALKAALPKVHSAFHELETANLSPVFEKLGGEHSYDELRIARLLLE